MEEEKGWQVEGISGEVEEGRDKVEGWIGEGRGLKGRQSH